MKTTLDLPDELLAEAKTVAARRKITLKDMVTHALKREIMPSTAEITYDSTRYEIGPYGILRLKKRSASVTPDTVRILIEEAEQEDFNKSLQFRNSS